VTVLQEVYLGIPIVPGSTGTTESPAAPDRPDSPQLLDSFGRVARDLRVSLTDRCNLRCTYCMPAEGLDWLPGPELLSDDELIRLLDIAVTRLGITNVRFTGGEPLLRRGITKIIAATAALSPRPRISITTNGIGLARKAVALAEAGLDRVNVSLDTLRADRFRDITRRDRLADVLAGLAAAADAGLTPVKLNAVLMRGVNDDEAAELLRYCLDRGYELRFIEQMPLDPQHGWDRGMMVTAEEILTTLRAGFDLGASPDPRGPAPAERWLVRERGSTNTEVLGSVGVIGSVTRPFCGDCDRTRLTADGQMRNCLFSQVETDLRDLLRSGADDENLADRWRIGMWGKLAGHRINDAGFAQPIRPMSAIGG
jgi:cyclic pyranopterin phosphate synthase